MNSKSLAITIAVVVGFGILLFLGFEGQNEVEDSFAGNKPQSREIVIGAILPSTGDSSAYGEDAIAGIDLAIEQANSAAEGTGVSYRVVYQDSLGVSRTAVNALEQVLIAEDPDALIGEIGSTQTGAMIPIATREQKILISPSASAPNLSGISDYFFRVFPSDVEEGAFMARTVASSNPGASVAVIYVNNDYGQGLRNIFSDTAEELGLNIVFNSGFNPDVRDFRSILARIESLTPDVIYMPSYYEDGGILIRQIRELGIEAELYGSTTHEDPQLIALAGDAAEGFKYPVSTGFDINDNSDYVQRFVSGFRAKYGRDPGLLAALGYDCAVLLIDGMRGGGEPSTAIRDYLLNTPNIQGAGGVMNFDENGDVQKPVVLRQITNGIFSNL